MRQRGSKKHGLVVEDLLHEAGFHGDDMKARRDSWSALVLLRDWIETGEPS